MSFILILIACVPIFYSQSDEQLNRSLDADTQEEQLQFAVIEAQYFIYNAWLKTDDQLTKGSGKILQDSKIPGTIVQGRYDLCCPMKSAWDLHKVSFALVN